MTHSFPDFPAEDFPALPEGFEESSYSNDICPSMASASLFIFVNYADKALRERDFRYQVCRYDPSDCEVGDVLLTTDDWAEVLALIAREA
jgi:hypothetical protein